MGTEGIKDLAVQFDLEKLKRPNEFGKIYRFCRLAFWGKSNAEYNNEELIKLLIEIKAAEKKEDLFIAIVIKNKDNSSICLSGSSTRISLEQGINIVSLKVPIDLLEEEIYRLHIEIISFDQYGRSMTYDNPFISFPFKVNKSRDNYIWPIRYYGHVREQGIIAEVLEGNRDNSFDDS